MFLNCCTNYSCLNYEQIRYKISELCVHILTFWATVTSKMFALCYGIDVLSDLSLCPVSL